ncbi:phosphoglycerate mutase-like protein [Trametes versicolor FP-101664 SS1]|uniref:phosphoglycerate mutase-like protein n=1 Tax=Trametes versicolor (strain FP-101664) TaxID=717944 RepID=UPI0004623717|nr:phosphoglycerate mutase-like protein [Trametes versicolor FP-101664 SS1]EIW60260.1 phosphoglycerate mutase-like protein [Trametes versicolor FP-101664 SS1]
MTLVARVYIVRHGETDDNRAGIIQGHLDTPLNAAGVRQACLAADALADVPFDAAYTSDLSRARKTAEIIMEAHPGVLLETSEALRERFMGDWQGRDMHARGDPPANLEPVAHLSTRAVQWWNTTVARLAQRKAAELASAGDASTFAPAHVLVVAHGGLIGTLVTTLTGSRKVRAAQGVVVGRCFNASISVVDVEEDGRGVLVSYADTTHLDVDLVQENADLLP